LNDLVDLRGGIVTSPATAIAVARVVIPAVFGAAALDGQEPFSVQDAGGFFWVIGAVPLQPFALPFRAPFWVAIRKRDGAILSMSQRVQPHDAGPTP
jgi:hypothetical protein